MKLLCRAVMALPLLVFTVQFACAQVDASSDVGDLFIGMPIRTIPNAGYIDLSCVDDASRKLRSWSESSECPLGRDQLRAVRFEFDPATSRDGTSIAGHPVILTALGDDSATLAGLKIDTDPEARLYMRKRRFARYAGKVEYGSEVGSACTSMRPMSVPLVGSSGRAAEKLSKAACSSLNAICFVGPTRGAKISSIVRK